MIKLSNKANCCGCEVCVNICPQKCIKMIEDSEGFRYLEIDYNKCIDCGLCEKRCPFIKEAKKDYIKSLEFYAGYNKDNDILKQSSSGGIFWLLAQNIILKNGIVYGVTQNDTYDVCFQRATKIEQCINFRGSKYLQAKINGIYKMVKEDLENKSVVLFSGTPCQIAGLYNYLNKKYDNLYTCDVVCHGVPSNKVYNKFIKYIEDKNKKKVKNIKWRDKVCGWGPNRITIYFDDNSSITTTSKNNMFQNGFLNNLYLRPSCYECKYAKLPRIGDISLADFWGYEGNLKQINNNKGISAIIISSDNGKKLFNEIKDNIEYHEVTEEFLTTRSRHSYKPPIKNNRRDEFFKDINKKNFYRLAKKYKMKNSKTNEVIAKIKRKIKKKGLSK